MFDNSLSVGKGKDSSFADVSRVDESCVTFLKSHLIDAIVAVE